MTFAKACGRPVAPAWSCETAELRNGDMKEMDDPDEPDQLYHDPDLVQFYDLENERGSDFAFCLDLARDARSVLDLGCGTGQLAAALAQGRRVTGVDPGRNA